MLDRSNIREVIDLIWRKQGTQIVLPDTWGDFFDRSGNMAGAFEDKRRFNRHYVRQRALLRVGEAYHCIYTVDISRNGLAILHSGQLFPKQEVCVWLPGSDGVKLKITRCHREGAKCYICGGRILGKAESSADSPLPSKAVAVEAS